MCIIVLKVLRPSTLVALVSLSIGWSAGPGSGRIYIEGTESFISQVNGVTDRAPDSQQLPSRSPLSLQDIQQRIRELRPTNAVHKRMIEEIELLGYNIEPGEVSRRSGLPVLRPGARYTLSYFWKCREPADLETDVLTQFSGSSFDVHHAEVPVSRDRLHIEAGRIGAVFRTDFDVRIPLSVKAGPRTWQVAFVAKGDKDPPEFIDIGKMFVESKPPLAGKRSEKGTKEKKFREDSNNRIDNFSFEEELSGDDWIVSQWSRRGVAASIDSLVSLHGRRSLQVEFSGGLDLNYYEIGQDVAVKPKTPYVLSYYLKTEGITSESGPRVEIYDAVKGYTYFATRTRHMVGSHDWTFVEHTFKTPSDTSSLTIRIRRYGQSGREWWTVDPRFGVIGGTSWFDFFQLVEAK